MNWHLRPLNLKHSQEAVQSLTVEWQEFLQYLIGKLVSGQLSKSY